jgi:hypothetical protein
LQNFFDPGPAFAAFMRRNTLHVFTYPVNQVCAQCDPSCPNGALEIAARGPKILESLAVERSLMAPIHKGRGKQRFARVDWASGGSWRDIGNQM